jgi:uncharacterized membrane protein YjfL (UPF0719 family)
MDTKKIITYSYYGLVVLLLVIYVFRTYSISNTDEILQQGPTSFGLWQSYIYIGIAVIAAVVLSLVGISQNPKALIWTLSGIGVLVVLFFIGRAMSSDVVPQAMLDDKITLAQFKMSHAGVWVAGVMITLTILLAIASSVKTIFDN